MTTPSRRRLALLLIVLPTAHAGAQVSAVDTSPSTFMVGPLRVIQQRRPASQTVAVELFLLGGARQIDGRNAGIEPLVLRTAGYGSAKYPGGQSARAMASTGSSVVIETDDDWTVFSLRTIRRELDSAWMVFADRVVHPTLDDDAIAAARRVMLADVVVSNANPDYLLQQIARPIAFAGHPYANDPGGSDRSLRAIRSQAVHDYHAAQFVASRMVLVVVGDVDRETLERLIPPTLGTLPAGGYTWALPPPIPVRTSTSMSIIPRELATDYIIGIFPGPLANSRDYGAFRLGIGLLGAFLNYQVREQEQLSYAANAPLYNNAALAGGLYASTEKPERVMELMIKQMEDVGSNAIPFQYVPLFVNQFQIEDLVGRETNAGQARALARAFLIDGDVTAVDRPFQALKGVSAGSLRSVIARFAPSVQFIFMGDTSRFRRYMR